MANATPIAGQPSGSSLTPTAEAPAGGFPLAGPSSHPDPRTHAYRQDLADVALAGTVIASHYAVPLTRHLCTSARLLEAPGADAVPLADLAAGAKLKILDISRGWAWGYAGGLVGYLPAEALCA